MTLRWLLVLAVLSSGSCAWHRAASLQEPEDAGPHTYLIPWNALDEDKVCADTRPSVSWRPCMTVRLFRTEVMDARVSP